MRCVLCFMLFTIVKATIEGSEESEFRRRYLSNISDYNKFERPPSKPSRIDVKVYIHIESIREISAESTLDFYLVQFWNDTRLPENKSLKITGKYVPDALWYPDTYFLLVRALQYSPEEQYIILGVDEKHEIEFNRKVRLRTPCAPNVILFPFDIAVCSLKISSFSYSDSELDYEWLGEGSENTPGVFVDRNNNHVDHLGFYFRSGKTMKYSLTYAAQNYSTLEVKLHLKRKYDAYLFQVYIPAALIVALSWTVFWINLRATPARASLGVTTVLTMLTLSTQSQTQNAKHVNSNMTAIDIYLWVSFFFVIFAMLEFALSDFQINTTSTTDDSLIQTNANRNVVDGFCESCEMCLTEMSNLISANVSSNHNRNTPICVHHMNGNALGNDPTTTTHTKVETQLYDKDGLPTSNNSAANRIARVVFPCLYITFNIIYWSTLFVLYHRQEY